MIGIGALISSIGALMIGIGKTLSTLNFESWHCSKVTGAASSFAKSLGSAPSAL